VFLFEFRARCERGVAAFGGENAGAIAARDQHRGAEARTGTDDESRQRGVDSPVAGDQGRLGDALEVRGIGEGGEIVDEDDAVQAQFATQAGNRNAPGQIGVDQIIATDQARTGDTSVASDGVARRIGEFAQDVVQILVVGADELAVVQKAQAFAVIAAGLNEPDAGMRSTDVGGEKRRTRHGSRMRVLRRLTGDVRTCALH